MKPVHDFKRFGHTGLCALMALACASRIADAASITIDCAREDKLVVGWTAPLALSYPGGASGDLALTSEHITFTLPAAQTLTTGVVDGTDVTATSIYGSGETSSVMPDPAALMACVENSLQPELQDDADAQALALLGCASKVAMSTSPIAVHASVSVGLFPGNEPTVPDVNVEIRRSYRNAKTPAGDAITIETYPSNCKLAGQ
ncbi:MULTISPECIES: hypothetical protein [unclassified Mesorhizobium]|uniref:hypothetical protein n=1 Tax=unclassified Mesorhizobium TaxID=325217 RepID=UPI000FCC05E0|nr:MULTISPECIES: hypothetical protein [unclassified Mesorhizobium]RUZ90691.1 hypothetical protein EN947_05725 [Mesorhizobium sp. M7A.F.Ca.US.003.02.2.1]RUZ01625.1 hypothetical protein EN974_06435 [Mesorhizobium sp. M7A.F.Ca.CA.001.12.2.1]RUZ26875.1 hypothetical protein EN949_11375 [Mesorhizobium sp. M7A.F.Ca.US.007.01.2.1]RUZ49614.1 hypothetical protein EN948_03965 [Mesorhizobium sp. M7A.F.Ca.US.003.02.1.1]RUZ69826.1 hypothetical protein EN950_02985 [Mesorhizobium sp. M7A.F.Ca.US.007.01.1.1]